MKVIPHRGCWNSDIPQNSLTALKKAFERFDGAEFDIRDGRTDIVIAHDAFQRDSESFESFLRTLSKSDKKKFMALNIKADGIGVRLKELLTIYEIENYMCFDLSFPESMKYLHLGLKVFERISDLERNDSVLNSSHGIVVDCFKDEIDLSSFKTYEGPVMLISPELHGRNFESFLHHVQDIKLKDAMICTDFPEEWGEVFHA